MADAGRDGEADHRFCREDVGADGLIPARERRSAEVIAAVPHRQEIVRRLGKTGDEDAHKAYGLRWKADMIMSIAGRGPLHPVRRDPGGSGLLRDVAYDVDRLVGLDRLA